MVLAAALFTLASQQGARVSLDLPFQPLELSVTALAGKSGMTLSVQQEIEREPVLIRVKDVPARELMDKIAHAASAEWRQTSTGWALERSDRLVEQLAAQEIAYQAKKYEKALERLLESAKPVDDAKAKNLATSYSSVKRQFDSDPSYTNQPAWMRTWEALEPELPVKRALVQILQAIGPRTLASYDSGERVIFSNDPNALQVQIDADLDEIFDELFRASNLLASEARKVMPEDVKMPPVAHKDLRLGASARPARAVVVWFAESAKLFAVDENDRLVASGSVELSAPGGSEYAETWRKLMADDKDVVPLSPLSSKLVASWSKEGGKGVSDAELRKVIEAPAEFDPLNLVVADLLKFYARDADLVACVPDFAFEAANRANTRNGPKPSVFALEMDRNSGLEVESSEGWFIAKSGLPLHDTHQRANRVALNAFIRDSLKQGSPTLELSSTLVASYGSVSHPSLVVQIAQLVGPSLLPHFENPPLILRFYASLDQGQLEGMAAGFALSGFGEDQLRMLLQILSYGNSGFGARLSPEEMALSRHDSNIIDWRTEVTELFGRGLLDTAAIKLEQDVRDIFVATEQNPGWLRTFPLNDAYAIASQIAGNEASNLPIRLLSLTPGYNRTLGFSVQAEDRNGYFRLSEWGRKPGEAAVPYEGLSEELKADIEAHLRKFRENRSASGGSRPPQN
jgi:hypothetical protein